MSRPQCSVDGCTARAQARGWCIRHYGAWYRNGDPAKLSSTPVVYSQNKFRRFTPESWKRLLDQVNEPHPHVDQLRAGIEQFRKMLDLP